MIVIIATAIACFIVGGVLSYILFRYALKSKYDNVLKEAETEAEVIKKNKLLEVKEKFLNKKADLEKEVALRNQKIQQAENKLKQREMVLGQRQEEIQRKKMEAEAVKENLEAQLVIVDKKKEELDKLQQQEIEKLEAIALVGLKIPVFFPFSHTEPFSPSTTIARWVHTSSATSPIVTTPEPPEINCHLSPFRTITYPSFPLPLATTT